MSSDGIISKVNLNKCIYFNVNKERYTPYTSFNGSFIMSDPYEEIISIKFFIDGNVIHYGSVDSSRITLKNNCYRLDISSRSYTLALGLNQPKPQLNTNVSLSSLFSGNVQLKNITYEKDSIIVNYIYVLDNSTLWDAVVAYALKAYNRYPYIYKTNEVRVNLPTDAKTRNYNNLIELFNGSTLSNLISHIHMRDTDGNYETYNITDDYSVSRDIIRHKQIPLDMQWLSSPDKALTTRINFAKRGTKYRGIKVLGYSGEELFDKFTYIHKSLGNQNCTIHKLNISGKNNVIYTTMYQYDDAYKY